MSDSSVFRSEIQIVINKFCMENGSDTPDFILANYLEGCLKVFDKAVRTRTDWYGPKVKNEIGDPKGWAEFSELKKK